MSLVSLSRPTSVLILLGNLVLLIFFFPFRRRLSFFNMLVFLGRIALPGRFYERSVYNGTVMSDQALGAKSLVKDLEKNAGDGARRKIVPKFPNRLRVRNLVVKTKIQETHERHSIIDLEFRLVVRQVIQTLKDEYLWTSERRQRVVDRL